MTSPDAELDQWNERLKGRFPGLVGMRLEKVAPDEIVGVFDIRDDLLAPNGYLHAGSIVTLADTCCGFGAMRNLPAGAVSFTTIDLNANFISSAQAGAARCSATPLHLGGRTQVWDAVVTASATGKRMAQFRCVQMVLWPKG